MDEELKGDLSRRLPVRVPPLAAAANRSVNALYLAIKRGEIASIRVGRSIRVPPSEAERILGIEAAA